MTPLDIRPANRGQTSLGTAAARTLATTTKTVPQMQGITPRWLLRLLPWVEAPGGSYRVNRRLAYSQGSGRVSLFATGRVVSVVPHSLSELPALRGLTDPGTLNALAAAFRQEEYAPGQVIVEEGDPRTSLAILAHGKARTTRRGRYGNEQLLEVLTDRDALGSDALAHPEARWAFTATALTPTTLLRLNLEAFQDLTTRFPALARQVAAYRASPTPPTNSKGEASIELASGHRGEAELPETYADYETAPRHYELAVAQAVLRVHSRVADIYSDPMDQLSQQLRLTVEALRERQEHDMVNNPEFGLLHNADLSQRLSTRTGPPAPEDLDDLLTGRRSTRLFLAHPRAIAAFGRECTRRGLYPRDVESHGAPRIAWRGVPFFPCDKIPVSAAGTTCILAMRTGEDDEGVVGLHQTGIPDEVQPSVNARFVGVDERGVISYLVSAYYSAAVLVPDALGILDDVETGRWAPAAAGTRGAAA